ncbi:MAG: Hsp20/alpha crystallin family protein [Anaerolineales bacterium]|nr:Hsp20/alpha crystallin family protein [Anaerolineales bacterium]
MVTSSVDLLEHRGETGELHTGPLHKHEYITTRYVWIRHSHIWRPPTDVFETEQAIRVQVEVAGMEKADFSVTMEGMGLRISGCRKASAERRIYHQMEIHTGEFLTEVELPVRVEPDFIQADYHDGFLIVELRKTRTPPDNAA